MYIIVKSFNKSLINKFCSNLINKSKKFNIGFSGIVNMPKKQKNLYDAKITSRT
jgi:ribosomal protein S10